MWINRIKTSITRVEGIAHLRVGPEWGTHFVVSEIDSFDRPLVWIDIDPQDSGIIIGNKLSDAVERAFGVRLFGYGLPFTYCFKRLADSASDLGPYYFVMSGEPPEGMNLDCVLQLDGPVVLCGSGHKIPDPYSNKTVVFGEEEFSLRLDEALEISLGRSPREHVEALYELSEGKYEDYIVSFQGALGLPPPERPYPDRYFALGTNKVSPHELVDAHIKRGYWIEAFELAIRACPDRVLELIENAAEQYLDKGLIDRLSEKLSQIDRGLWHHERIVYWTLSAAIATNSHRRLIPTIRQQVIIEDMPDVRALLAIQNLTQTSLVETKAAYDSRKNVTTTRAHAFCLSQFGMPDKGLSLLMSALGEAQSREKGRELISIGSDVAHAHTLLGDYQTSLAWAEWALAGFNKYNVNEEILRLFVKSQVQYMRLLTSDELPTPTLTSELVEFDLAGIPTFEAVISTLGDFEFVSGRYEVALQLYERNSAYQSREQSGHFTLDVCRALLALGRHFEARELAHGAIGLAKGTNDLNQLKAGISHALTLASSDPPSARIELEHSLSSAVQLNQWDAAAICGIALASSWLESGSRQSAAITLRQAAQGLEFLGSGGWQLFGGWHPNLREIRDLWSATKNPTRLSFLNGLTIVRQGEESKLSLRNAEILAVLAMHPEGLSGEQLSEKLYMNEPSSSTLKSALSKLRSVISIESQPYRFAELVETDFQQVEDLLERGKHIQALFLYKGPLMPESSAPEVVSYREYLDEAVRQAALALTDADSLFEFAQKRNSDLEVWESVFDLLEPADVRKPFVKARVMKLRQEWEPHGAD